MKSMTCRDLGGACDLAFTGERFEEIEAQSRAHGMEMFRAQDPAHLQAMSAMRKLMENPGQMAEWYEGKRREFEAL